MTDTIMTILQWAILPGGISTAIAWIANRKVKKAESDKQVHDTYKKMYEDISTELLKTQKRVDESNRENARAIEELNRENMLTRRALNRLSRAVEAIQLCPHRANCPVSSELQNGEDADDDGAARGSKKRQQRKPKTDGGNKQPPRGEPADVDATGEG